MSFFIPQILRNYDEKKIVFLSYKYAHVSVQVCNFLIFLTSSFNKMHLHCTYWMDSHYNILKFKKKFICMDGVKGMEWKKPTFYCCRLYLAPYPPTPMRLHMLAAQRVERLSGMDGGNIGCKS
jgi:hypothetical protein